MAKTVGTTNTPMHAASAIVSPVESVGKVLRGRL